MALMLKKKFICFECYLLFTISHLSIYDSYQSYKNYKSYIFLKKRRSFIPVTHDVTIQDAAFYSLLFWLAGCSVVLVASPSLCLPAEENIKAIKGTSLLITSSKFYHKIAPFSYFFLGQNRDSWQVCNCLCSMIMLISFNLQ